MAADWAELEKGILALIARRLNLIEDYLNFGTVCKSWHSVTTKSNFNSDLPRVPWLMLPEEDGDSSYSKFFSLYNGMILKKRISKASGKRCVESMGWLITVENDKDEVSLLHPFSGVVIELPHRNTIIEEEFGCIPMNMLWSFFEKAVLSASPSHTSDYVLGVIDKCCLNFWRPGDLSWTSCVNYSNSVARHVDVVYFSGYFYAVDALGRVILYDVAQPRTTTSHIVTRIPYRYSRQLYILESLGSLFVVSRNGVDIRVSGFDFDDGSQERTYWTTKFRVFQIDLASGKATRTRELGDRAFFLGYNASISVQASQFPGIKPNHIYYTDNLFESSQTYNGRNVWDMGVFNLEDGSIQPHYQGVTSRVCPPTWVTPTLY